LSGLSKEWGPSHIFIDCTETFLSGNKTGIQRVVRSIVERSDLMSRHAGIPCVPVVSFGRRFYPLSHFPSLQNNSSRRGGILEAGKEFYHRVDGFWQAFSSFWIPKRKGGKEKAARDRRIGNFPSARTLIKQSGRNALMRLSSVPLRALAGAPVIPGPGDLLLMPDMFWGISDPIHAAADFRKRGGVVIPVIYDLIPLRFPSHCHERSSRQSRAGSSGSCPSQD